MLDKTRLFKIFLSLSREPNYFIIAQDAYVILASINTQLDSLETIISDYNKTVEDFQPMPGKETEIGNFETVIDALREVLRVRHIWQSLIAVQLPTALEFWCCAPVDNAGVSSSSSNRGAIERWRIYQDHRDEIPDEMKANIAAFKRECENIIHSHFGRLFAEFLAEEKLESEAVKGLPTCLKLADYIPLGLIREFDATNDSFTVITDFPLTHFLVPDPRFARLLGYSVARLLTVPLLTFIVNTLDIGHLVESLNADDGSAGSVAIVFYRSATRDVIGAHWEICKEVINGHFIAHGVNITKDVANARDSKVDDTEQLLRKWLHSIRNASFQQQAEVISQDIEALQKKIGSNSEYIADFTNINNGLKTLIYTTRASVSLIDQVLDSKALSNSSPVREFVSAVAQFPVNFAMGEGINNLPSKFELFLNGAVARVEDLSGLHVAGDLSSLTTIIDNIYSNAVRYTNYSLGVYADMHIHTHETTIQLVLSISDHCPGGLPDDAVSYLKLHLCREQIIDNRNVDKNRLAMAMHFSDDDVVGLSYRRNSNSFRSVNNSSRSCGSSIRSNGSSFRTSRSHGSIASNSAQVQPDGPPPSNNAQVSTQGRGRSSLTGLPHIVEIYHELTRSGETDFNMVVTTKSSGSTFLISAAFQVAKLSGGNDIIDCCEEDESAIMAKEKAREDERLMLADRRLILIVDDSHVVRRILERYMKKMGVASHSCADGVDALEWFKENASNCRGMITDLEMPKMGGEELISHVLEIDPFLPCVVVSGNNIAVSSIPRGAIRAILKPITIDQTRSVLMEMVDYAAR